MAINRQCHGAPGPWQSARDAQADVPSFTPLPYRPAYRQHLWCTDMRYLVQLEGSWVSSLWLIEGYARKLGAGRASPHHDRTAMLQILFAALAAYGCPHALVADNGSVLTAQESLAILRD
jgi:hypothetical protein